LRFFNRTTTDARKIGDDAYVDVEPRHNSIIFFPSEYMHEVMPVICPSREFVDSRFTINGWVRRPDPTRPMPANQLTAKPSSLAAQVKASSQNEWVNGLFQS
jgi:hypothetical protein